MRLDRASLWSESAGSNRTLWLTAAILLVTLIVGVSGSFADADGIQRGIDAGAARYEAMAESYLAESEASRCAGLPCLASFYGQGSASQTDVRSYAERTRVQADQQELAVNPELKYVRAYSQSSWSTGACVRTSDDRLATNPELAIATRMSAC